MMPTSGGSAFARSPSAVRWVVLVAASLLFLAYAIDPVMVRWRRRATRVAPELLGVMVAWNILRFYVTVGRGTLHAAFPVPFSLFVAAALGWMWWMAGDDRLPVKGWKPLLIIALTVLACMVVFPVLQMFCFGKTAYRPRTTQAPADLAVVFGAECSPMAGQATPCCTASKKPSNCITPKWSPGCIFPADALKENRTRPTRCKR